jgi:Amt family ammonium transporter
VNGHWVQIGWQAANSFAGLTYSFVVTASLLLVIDHIPMLKIAADELGQEKGLDEVELGEFAYDFVEKRRTFADIPPTENHVGRVEPREDVEVNLEDAEA